MLFLREILCVGKIFPTIQGGGGGGYEGVRESDVYDDPEVEEPDLSDPASDPSSWFGVWGWGFWV